MNKTDIEKKIYFNEWIVEITSKWKKENVKNLINISSARFNKLTKHNSIYNFVNF